jgi:hypothetical protein
MDENEKTSAEQPAVLPGQAVDQQSNDVSMEDLTDRREQKTLEYLRSALAIKDPLVANVSLMNADLMFYAHEIRRMIEPALKMASADLSELANLFPAMDGALRVHRQSERLSVFINRLGREQAAAEKTAAKVGLKDAESGAATMQAVPAGSSEENDS